jgi:hypothetical protein
MAPNYGPKIPRASDLIHLLDAYNSKHTSGTGNISDAINGISWTRYSVTDIIDNGIAAFDLNSSYLETSTATVFGQYYTCFYLWKPKSDSTTWKTLHRNSLDHLALVSPTDFVSLGMYSNRNGAFRDSGYDITNNVWQTLIYTGEGNSPTDSVGTTSFYVNGIAVGTSDRVACGTTLFRIGWPGQPPGLISMSGVYNRLLNSNEIFQLNSVLKARI